MLLVRRSSMSSIRTTGRERCRLPLDGHEGHQLRQKRRVNSTGVFLGCKHAIGQFLKQEPNHQGRRGWIVNVSSMLGYVGIRGGTGLITLPFFLQCSPHASSAAYCASKGAVLNLTHQIALDYAKDRIHCNALCPGFTKTAMTKGNYENEEVNRDMISTTPWGNWGTPEDVAKAAVFLASDDAAWVTGVGLPVDGGYLAQ